MATLEGSLLARAVKDQSFQYYHYEPSTPAAIIFIVLFGLATLLHLWQMFRTRTWFLIPFVIGGIFEAVGYIGRLVSAGESPGPYTLGPFIIQSVLLLVAPALFAASIYMELGRIVLMVKGDDLLFIRRTWLTKIFVIGDVISFFVQSSGAGLLAKNDPDAQNAGKYIVLGGLLIQIIFFALFVIAAAVFHLRLSKAPTQLSYERPASKHLLSLYLVSGLIFARSIVRVVEFVQGYSGFIMSHEVFLYTFDAVPMFLAVGIMNWIHPGEVAKHVRALKGSNEVRRDDEVSLEGNAV